MAVVERWKPILGFESRYEVSNLGRVKSLSFMQRYLLRTGAEAYRRTKERVVAQQGINSGYLIVHLHLDNVRVAKLVHRLVAVNFVPGFDLGREVNHKDGNKKHIRLTPRSNYHGGLQFLIAGVTTGGTST